MPVSVRVIPGFDGVIRFRLKLLPGIDRPALVSALPTASGGKVWMLDLRQCVE